MVAKADIQEGIKPAKAKETPAKVTQNGITMPRPGTTTGRVWEIADDISHKTNTPAVRKDVLEQAIEEGINSSTAATQYGQWCKFHGLTKEVKTSLQADDALEDVEDGEDVEDVEDVEEGAE
jgi:hypothetical protein